MKEFHDKVVMVTGAGSGIGRASATLFASRGARVLVCDIDGDGGKRTVQLIEDGGGTAEFFQCDVSARGAVDAAVDRAIAIWGDLHCAHNNVGIGGPYCKLHEVTDEDWDRTVQVTLTGAFLSMRAELKYFTSVDRGTIVNTASTAGIAAVPGMPVYSAVKHGVVGLTRSGTDYAHRGIRINAVAPGATRTPAFLSQEDEERQISGRPIHRLAEPEEIAEVVVWLASDRASFLSGAIVVADGGTTAIVGGGAMPRNYD